MHPGDVRMVQAIGNPEDAPPGLTTLTNCVVFACNGDRSLPSMLAGGDLDGDIYSLVMDERLFPEKEYPPGDYEPSKLVQLDRPTDVGDMANFVTEYIKVRVEYPSGTISKVFSFFRMIY
jgi:RNA-dependent RNA polymerase